MVFHAIFGPDDSYLFNAPSRWSMSGLPNIIQQAFNNRRVQEIIDLEFAPGGSFFFFFMNPEGGQTWYKYNLPAELDQWLDDDDFESHRRDLESLRTSLGPNNSFYACDRYGAVYDNLPGELASLIQRDPFQKPPAVCLGLNGSWVFQSEYGALQWSRNLGEEYPDLLKLLIGYKNTTSPLSIILSSFRHNCFVVYDPANIECVAGLSSRMEADYRSWEDELTEYAHQARWNQLELEKSWVEEAEDDEDSDYEHFRTGMKWGGRLVRWGFAAATGIYIPRVGI